MKKMHWIEIKCRIKWRLRARRYCSICLFLSMFIHREGLNRWGDEERSTNVKEGSKDGEGGSEEKAGKLEKHIIRRRVMMVRKKILIFKKHHITRNTCVLLVDDSTKIPYLEKHNLEMNIFPDWADNFVCADEGRWTKQTQPNVRNFVWLSCVWKSWKYGD